MIVISDTTPVISLIKAGQLELLQKMYETVLIPKAVYTELTENIHFPDEAEQVKNCPYLIKTDISNQPSVDILRTATGLDAGESESLVLYTEKNADLLLIDENKGRKIAKQMQVKHIGTIGLLIYAYEESFIKATEVEACLDLMLSSKIRLSRELCNKAMRQIGINPKY